MKKAPVLIFIAFATILFGYALPVKNMEMEPYAVAGFADQSDFSYVNISELSAKYVNKVIEIKWEADTERDNKQFEIQRSIDGDEFKTIGLIFTIEPSDSPKKYFFKDDLKGVERKKVFYRIKQINNADQYRYSDIVATELQKKKM